MHGSRFGAASGPRAPPRRGAPDDQTGQADPDAAEKGAGKPGPPGVAVPVRPPTGYRPDVRPRQEQTRHRPEMRSTEDIRGPGADRGRKPTAAHPPHAMTKPRVCTNQFVKAGAMIGHPASPSPSGTRSPKSLWKCQSFPAPTYPAIATPRTAAPRRYPHPDPSPIRQNPRRRRRKPVQENIHRHHDGDLLAAPMEISQKGG